MNGLGLGSAVGHRAVDIVMGPKQHIEIPQSAIFKYK